MTNTQDSVTYPIRHRISLINIIGDRQHHWNTAFHKTANHPIVTLIAKNGSQYRLKIHVLKQIANLFRCQTA